MFDEIVRSPWKVLVAVGVVVVVYVWTGNLGRAWSDNESFMAGLGAGAVTLGLLLGLDSRHR